MSLLKESGVYLSATFLVNAGGFLLIPILTRYLPAEEYGILGAVAVFGAVLQILTTLGLHGSVSRFYYDYRDDPARLPAYISSVLATLGAVGGGLLALLLLWGELLFGAVFGPTGPRFYPYGLAMAAITYGTALAAVPLTLFRVRNQATRYATAELGRFLIGTSATLYLVVGRGQGALGRLLGECLAVFIVAGVLVGLLARAGDLVRRFDTAALRASFAFGLPLVPHLLCQLVIGMADRILIGRLRSLEELGVFTVAASLASVMNVVVTSINSAHGPWLFDMAKKRPDAQAIVARTATQYVGGVGLIALVGVLFSREIIALFLPITYRGVAGIVPLLVLGHFFHGLYYFLANILFYAKRTRVLVGITGGVAVASLAGNLALIPAAGASGAAWVFVLSGALYCTLIYTVAQRSYPVSYELGRIFFCVFVLLLGLLNLAIDDSWHHAAFGAGYLALLTVVVGRGRWRWFMEPRLLAADAGARTGS